MQRIGFILFVVGVIISSWYAARFVPDSDIHASGDGGTITAMDRVEAWGEVAGWWFAGGAVLMLAGGVITRRAMTHSKAQDTPGAHDTHHRNTRTMLKEIESAVAALPADNPQSGARQLRASLDKIIDDLIPAFVDQQSQHIAHLGAATFIEMNSAFASAERALARAWSALTDESWAEVGPCIESARQSIASAVRIAG